MTCMQVPAWSERGSAPRRNRLSHPIKHYAEVGRISKSGGAKITLRQKVQKGTTKVG
jgi:hypothetical protein